MHGWGTRMLLKHYLDAGVSKAELSRRFGISRRTIHHWIETGQLDRDLAESRTRYTPRPRPPHKLDPFKGIIDARLGEFPRLTAQRLFDEVRAAGYAGGYSRVRDYVRVARPREADEPAVRFETQPGHQGQVDFGTFTLPWGRRHALLVVLGHSRLLWLRFYPRQTMAVLTGDWRARSRASAACRRSCCSTRCARWSSRTTGRPAGAGHERGVPALLGALGLRGAVVPGVPRQDEGQGGAADPLPAGEFLLRPEVRRRRGSQRAGGPLARGHRQRARAALWPTSSSPSRRPGPPAATLPAGSRCSPIPPFWWSTKSATFR